MSMYAGEVEDEGDGEGDGEGRGKHWAMAALRFAEPPFSDEPPPQRAALSGGRQLLRVAFVPRVMMFFLGWLRR
jgi:hypothetical protein